MPLDGARTLAWRLARQALDPVADATAAEITERVVALRGWPADLADLAICVRQATPDPGGLARALAAGELIRSYAFRGGSYVFTPADGAVLLAAHTATRTWEKPRFQQQAGFRLDDWEPFREAIAEALVAGPMTRAEISAHLAGIPALRHLAEAATGAGADTLYKPLHWWGDLCFGPTRDGVATFRLLRDDPRWPGPMAVDEAGRAAILRYLAAYGPATLENLTYWLTEGLGVPRRRVHGWLAELADEVTAVEVDGVAAHVRTADLDDLAGAEAGEAVRLLPGFDPWVMGPGTADLRLLAPERRGLASRGAHLVIRGGVVCGTWRIRDRGLVVSWFDEAGPAPRAALADETDRLARIRGHPLELALAR